VPLAHSFGERYDLPLPLALFVLGGALVVVASFIVARGRGAEPVADLPDGLRTTRADAPLGWLSVVVTAGLVWVGLAGTQEVSENLLPTFFWLLVWIAVPLSCGLLGDWTVPVNPFAFLSRVADSDRARRALLARDRPVAWPERAGWWPAVALFVLLATGELVFNLTATQPRVIATGLLVYALACLVAGLLFGPAWEQRGEVFRVLFATWGRLGWFRFGEPGRRGFAGGLDASFAPAPSRALFVLLLLVSVNVDGILATPRWAAVERAHPDQPELLRLALLVVVTLVVGGVFTAFAHGAARVGGHGTRPLPALVGLLPSMVPIAYAYLLAHNAQYLLVNAQLLPELVGNPIGQDRWPWHPPYPFDGGFDPHPGFLPSAFYWYVGLVAIVGGHVLAVVLAHRHLHARGSDPRRADASEYRWLIAMVGYTMLSLVLIAQPLVKETSSGPATGIGQSASNRT
jgi:hypothetical protein